MTRRPPDAGTTSEWSVVGDMKVYVWRDGLPVVLGRERNPDFPAKLVAVQAGASRGGSLITMSPHQARAVASVLLAAAAFAERED